MPMVAAPRRPGPSGRTGKVLKAQNGLGLLIRKREGPEGYESTPPLPALAASKRALFSALGG